MKITKTDKEVSNSELRKSIANQGCNICPCCGETKTTYDYMDEEGIPKFLLGGLSKGIDSTFCKNYCKGFFNMKYMQIDCYKCYTCGAEWESEPYEV